MTDQQAGTDPAFHATSAGHTGSTTGWLDAHFETCRPEYEALLSSVGLRPGWHVLDAGAGSGGFLPLLAKIVGSTGHITALDLAPENVAIAEQRTREWALSGLMTARVGEVTDLPFPDAHFDAIWFANTTQYLEDADLAQALAEFRRVVRPGGVVAVKEQDGVGITHAPQDPALLWRMFEALRPAAMQIRGVLRARQLRRWLERAGLEAVEQRTVMIERWAPLLPAEREFIGSFYAALAEAAVALNIPELDKEFWRAQRDAASPGNVLNEPDYYYCEGNVVAVGRVPI